MHKNAGKVTSKSRDWGPKSDGKTQDQILLA